MIVWPCFREAAALALYRAPATLNVAAQQPRHNVRSEVPQALLFQSGGGGGGGLAG